jgi:hypothetical protein
MKSWMAWALAPFLMLAVPSAGWSATISFAQAAQALVTACGADIEALCQGVKPGGSRIQDCLAKNSSKVSAQCKQTYADVFKSIQKREAAQTAVLKICQPDARRICSNFNSGNARILRCLTRKDNVGKVTNKCNQAITDAGWR